jgi:hypothetical protein
MKIPPPITQGFRTGILKFLTRDTKSNNPRGTKGRKKQIAVRGNKSPLTAHPNE